MPDRPVISVEVSSESLQKFVAGLRAQMNAARAAVATIQAQIANEHAKIVAGITGIEKTEAAKRIATWKAEAAAKRAEIAKLRVDAAAGAEKMKDAWGGAPWPITRIMGGFTAEGAAQFLGISALGNAVMAAIRNLPTMLKDAALSAGSFAHEIDILSQKTGIAHGTLLQFSAIGKTVGIDLQDMVVAARTLSKAITGVGAADTIEGSTTKGAKVLVALGIATKDTAGKARSMGDVMLDLADVFKQLPDGPEKSRAAIELLGRSGMNLIPFLNLGREGVQGFSSAMAELEPHVALNAKLYGELEIAQARYDIGMMELKSTIAESLLPTITELITNLGYLASIKAQGGSLTEMLLTGKTAAIPGKAFPLFEFAKSLGIENLQLATAGAADELDRMMRLALSLKEEIQKAPPGAGEIGKFAAGLEFIVAGGFQPKNAEQAAQAAVLGRMMQEGLVEQSETQGKINDQTDEWLKKLHEVFGAHKESREEAERLRKEWELAKVNVSALVEKVKAVQDLMEMPAKIQAGFAEAFLAGKIKLPAAAELPINVPGLPANLAGVETLSAALKTLNIEEQLGADTVQRELQLRTALDFHLKKAVQDRLSAGTATDGERAALEKLLEALDANAAKLKAVRDEFAKGSVLGGLISGFSELTNIISRFSGGLGQAISQVGAMVEVVTTVYKKLSAIGAKVQETGSNFSKGIKESLKSIFGTQEGKRGEGIAGAMEYLATVAGSIGQMFQAGAANKILGGATAGAMIGAIFGPIGMAIGAAIGGLIGTISALWSRAARGIAKDVSKAVNEITNAFRAGTAKLGDTIRELSGEKGGEAQLEKILPGLDQALADLRKQQKDIIDAFDTDLSTLGMATGIRDVSKAIDEVTKRVKEFLDSLVEITPEDVAKANQFLADSMREIFVGVADDVRDAELETIDLLEKEIDLQKQRSDVIKTAADQERAVRARLGITKPVTPAQQAALDIKAIREQRDEQLASIDRELKYNEAQLEGKTALFNLTLDLNALESRRLELTRLITQEWVAQRQALTDFMAAYREQINAAMAMPTAANMPNLPNLIGLAGTQTSTVFTVNGDLNIEVPVPPGSTPAEAWKLIQSGIQYGMEQR